MATRYWIASTSQNWNSTSYWSASTGGAFGASVPTSADAVIIDSNGTGTCVINTDATWLSLAKSAGSVSINAGITLTITNTLTNSAGTFNLVASEEEGEEARLTVGGNFTDSSSGDFTPNDGIITLSGNCTFGSHLVYSAEGTQTADYGNVILAGTSKTFASSSRMHCLTVNGSYSASGNITFYDEPEHESKLTISEDATFTYSPTSITLNHLSLAGLFILSAGSQIFLVIRGGVLDKTGTISSDEDVLMVFVGADQYISPGDYEPTCVFSTKSGEDNSIKLEAGDYSFVALSIVADGGDNIIDFNGANISSGNIEIAPSEVGTLTIQTNGARITVDGDGGFSISGDTIWESTNAGVIISKNANAIILHSDHNDTNIYDKILIEDSTAIVGNEDVITCRGLQTTSADVLILNCDLIINGNVNIDGYVQFDGLTSLEVTGTLFIHSTAPSPTILNGLTFNIGGISLLEHAKITNCDASEGTVVSAKYSYDGGGNDNFEFLNQKSTTNPSDFKIDYEYTLTSKGIGLKELSVPLRLQLIGYSPTSSLKFYGKSASDSSYTLLKTINHIDGDGIFTYDWVCRQQGMTYQWYGVIASNISTEQTAVSEFTVSGAKTTESKFTQNCKGVSQAVYAKKLLVYPNFGKSGNGGYLAARTLARLAKQS